MKNKNLYLSKEPIMRKKSQEWEKILTIFINGKGLISRIYKEPLLLFIYCCEANYLKTWGLKINICYLTVSVSQESSMA